MSTNPNTKTYWRRVSRMARELEFRLSLEYDDKSVTDILTAKDPKATRTIAESYLSVIRDNPRIPIVSMMGRSISPQHLVSASPASDRQKPLSPAPRLAYFVKE